jgi:hypothetical protein
MLPSNQLIRRGDRVRRPRGICGRISQPVTASGHRKTPARRLIIRPCVVGHHRRPAGLASWWLLWLVGRVAGPLQRARRRLRLPASWVEALWPLPCESTPSLV